MDDDLDDICEFCGGDGECAPDCPGWDEFDSDLDDDDDLDDSDLDDE